MNVNHREQIADLILKDPENRHLVITSTLHKNADGSMQFEVGEDRADGDRYRVTIKIEEC